MTIKMLKMLIIIVIYNVRRLSVFLKISDITQQDMNKTHYINYANRLWPLNLSPKGRKENWLQNFQVPAFSESTTTRPVQFAMHRRILHWFTKPINNYSTRSALSNLIVSSKNFWLAFMFVSWWKISDNTKWRGSQ